MTRPFNNSAPVDTTPAKCYPEAVSDGCESCKRWRIGNTPAPEYRSSPVIDATRIQWPGNACPMRIGQMEAA